MAQSVIGALRVNLGMNAGEFNSQARTVGSALDNMAKRAQRLASVLGTAFAVSRIVNFGRMSIAAFAKQDKAVKAVEATLRTTGGTAGYTSKQLQKMAADLQQVSLYGDEEILQKVTNNFLTFGNITGEVFAEAQKQALNLSAVFGQDLQSSTIMLGKALNDPVLGMTALSRVGIGFTEQQKKQVKAMVEANNTFGAQKLILDEIKRYYGEAAAAAAQSAEGPLTQAANAFADAMESIGQSIAPIVNAAAAAIKYLSERFQELSPELRRAISVSAGAAAALTGLAVVGGTLAVVLGAVAGPVALVVAGLAALAGVVAYNWRGISNLAKAAYRGFKYIYDVAKKWILDNVMPIFDALKSAVMGLVKVFNYVSGALGFDKIFDAMTGKANGLRFIVEKAATAIKDEWNKGADDIAENSDDIANRLTLPATKASGNLGKLSKDAEEAKKKILKAQEELAQKGVALVEQMKTPQEILAEKAKALDMALAKNSISAAQFGDAMKRATMVAVNSYAGMAGEIANNLATAFGNSKAFAIASAVINTAESVTKTLATYGFTPWGIALAASAAAAGMAQIAAIKSASKNSSGGSASSGVTPAAEPASGGGSGGGGVQQLVNINLHGETYGREQVRGLIMNINEAVADGAVLKVS